MKLRVFLVLLVGVLMASACDAQVATPALRPTLTMTPRPTFTATAVPTNTPMPTATPTVTPSPTPTMTATPEPTPASIIHVVKAGESLGLISQIYGVSIDELVRINNIQNPSLISVGMELIIPVTPEAGQ